MMMFSFLYDGWIFVFIFFLIFLFIFLLALLLIFSSFFKTIEVALCSLQGFLINNLELLDNINGNGAQVTAHQRHASLLIARDKERTAAIETVPIMLTRHSIATINGTKDIARQLSGMMVFRHVCRVVERVNILGDGRFDLG